MSTASLWRSSRKLFSNNVVELQTTTSKNVKNGKLLLNNYQRHVDAGHRVLQTYAVDQMKTISWWKYWKLFSKNFTIILEQNTKNVQNHVKNGFAKYAMQMKTRPYNMNVMNATIFGFTGDMICQKVVEKQEQIDWKRTARFTFFCAYYQGIICTSVYRSVQTSNLGPIGRIYLGVE